MMMVMAMTVVRRATVDIDMVVVSVDNHRIVLAVVMVVVRLTTMDVDVVVAAVDDDLVVLAMMVMVMGLTAMDVDMVVVSVDNHSVVLAVVVMMVRLAAMNVDVVVVAMNDDGVVLVVMVRLARHVDTLAVADDAHDVAAIGARAPRLVADRDTVAGAVHINDRDGRRRHVAAAERRHEEPVEAEHGIEVIKAALQVIRVRVSPGRTRNRGI
jgi:hypothetical protein